jgi:hypothetical protein
MAFSSGFDCAAPTVPASNRVIIAIALIQDSSPRDAGKSTPWFSCPYSWQLGSLKGSVNCERSPSHLNPQVPGPWQVNAL